MAQLSLDCIGKVGTVKAEDEALPPFNADQLTHFYKANSSQVKLRPAQLCNQYLLIASTEKESDEVLDSETARTGEQINVLSAQVKKGFKDLKTQVISSEVAQPQPQKEELSQLSHEALETYVAKKVREAVYE